MYLASGPGMGIAVQPDKMAFINLCITLGCRQAGMSKQFLNGAQIASFAKQMRGKGVSERM